MRIFTSFRKLLHDNTELRLEIEQIKKKINNQDQNIETVFKYLDQLLDKDKPEITREKIGFRI